MYKLLFAIFIIALCCACITPAMAQEGTASVAPPAPELAPEIAALDPLAAGALDGLASDLTALEQQANIAYQNKSYLDAAKLYLALLAREPRNAGALYNLACCYGLLAKDEQAARCLQLAVKAGWGDIEWAKGDPDFAAVRGKPAFDAALAGLTAEVQQQQAGLGELAHFAATSYLPCRVMLPDGYDPEQTYPLIVGLHGYGDNHERFTGLRKKMGGAQVIFAVPEAPYPFPQGTMLGYSWMEGGAADSDMPWKSVADMTTRYVMEVVRGLKARYKVGEVYLFGFSQGCGLAYMVGLSHPEEFAGLVCCGGWLDEEWLGAEQLAASKGVRVFIVHGNEDTTVEFASGTGARDKLKELGYDVTFYEFKGGHRVPEDAVQAAMKWLLHEQ